MAPNKGSQFFNRLIEHDNNLQMAKAGQTQINQLVIKSLSRRKFIGNSTKISAAAFIMAGNTLLGRDLNAMPNSLSFEPVAANSLDTITVPRGYNWHVVVSWGDPLWSAAPDFNHETRGTGSSQETAFGDNNDGMSLFTKNGRHILVVNHEYINRRIMYGGENGTGFPQTADDIRKGKAGHGVSVVELTQTKNLWQVIKDSPYNRRITADSPMELAGPASAHRLLKTSEDPSGMHSKGTWNNCGNGRTPWGTYLACEENFNGYFSSSNTGLDINPQLKRYGIGLTDWGYGWAQTDDRFDISKHPNEPNRSGYVVEIDPLDPTSTPRKRTALGRFKHENAEVILCKNGHIVIYMGDDERGEFLYRFVSKNTYIETGDNTGLLDTGTLYAAKFEDDGKGHWIELTPKSTNMRSHAEICIHTRQAGSAVGATTMDRPEWIAANPKSFEVYCCLTNNENRGIKGNAGGDFTPVGGPNPREKNIYGQIIRWVPKDGDHTAESFEWSFFVIAGNPVVHNDEKAGSKNINAKNMFNSPDGLAFGRNGFLWIQTDGKYHNSGDFLGQGNNQMLVGDPVSGKIERFLVGPKECEITGFAWGPEETTLFVGIQHPGQMGGSHFPGGGDSVPRSSVIAIARDDGKSMSKDV